MTATEVFKELLVIDIRPGATRVWRHQILNLKSNYGSRLQAS